MGFMSRHLQMLQAHHFETDEENPLKQVNFRQTSTTCATGGWIALHHNGSVVCPHLIMHDNPRQSDHIGLVQARVNTTVDVI